MTDKKVPPAVADFLVAENAAKRGPVKSLYVEIKREEVEGMRARIAELETSEKIWQALVSLDELGGLVNEAIDTELAALKEQQRGGVVLPDRANPTNIRAILGEVGVHSQANQSFAELVYNHALDTVARLNPPGECVAVPRELLGSICSSNNNALSRLPELRTILAQHGKAVGDE